MKVLSSNRPNIFQFIIIINSLKIWSDGIVVNVKQGAYFNLTCQQSPEVEDHNLGLGVSEDGNSYKCFAGCSKMLFRSIQCERLFKLTTDILCGSGANCYMEPQCNFTLKSNSMSLDGMNVNCLDNSKTVYDWTIKGFQFFSL